MSKTVIVTGGSRGIGRAAAILCGRRGWRVVVNYVGAEAAAQETATAVEAAGGQALVVQGDVAKSDDVERLFSACVRRFGAPDGVVANAGIVQPIGKFLDMDEARWRKLFDINVIGLMLTVQAAGRLMLRSRGGRGGSIVCVSSAAARLGGGNMYVDYAATKGAVDVLAHGIGLEWADDGVRVNALRPGMIDTEIHAAAGEPDRVRQISHMLPMKRAGTAQEVAEAIVWLLDDASSYVTGSILDVSGGR